MKREIKFRAWIDKEKQIREAVNIDFHYGKISYKTEDYKKNFSIGYIKMASFKEIKLMQFTGLKDINGVDIYEGDIVECQGAFSKVVAEVIYDNSSQSYRYKFIGDMLIQGYIIDEENNFKVIGNIYENPELLKTE